MRPTNLGFRSPKEKSGEFVIPQMHYNGVKLSLIRQNTTRQVRSPSDQKRFTTFSGQDRFSYKNHDILGEFIGPTSYRLENHKSIMAAVHSSRRNRKVPVIGYPMSKNNCYTIVGDQIVYDETFANIKQREVHANRLEKF